MACLPIQRETVASVQNGDVDPGGLDDVRVTSGRNGRPATSTTQAEVATPARGQSDSEQVLDLRGAERGMRTEHLGDRASDQLPPPIPGWRFVDEGDAIAFSDGRAWRRTIVLPRRLGDRPERGLRRVLRAMGGMRPPRRHDLQNLDQIRRLTLLLVVMTEYRELLHRAALDGFRRPLMVERDVQFVLGAATPSAAGQDVKAMDVGSLQIDLDRLDFAGSRYARSATARLARGLHEDIDGGQLSVVPSGDRSWQLHRVSPVGVFAAATACRMTAEESQRHRGQPAKTAAGLLDPMDPTLPIPGDDLVLELEALCRDMAPPVRGRG